MTADQSTAQHGDPDQTLRSSCKSEKCSLLQLLQKCDSDLASKGRYRRSEYHLDIDHLVLSEMLRFLYTGMICVDSVEDVDEYYIELLIQSDQLSIDSLFQHGIEYFGSSNSVQAFYDLETLHSLHVLREPVHSVSLLELLRSMFTRNYGSISDHPDFPTLSANVLVYLLTADGDSIPVTVMHKWNVNFDKLSSDLEVIRGLLSSESEDKIDDFELLDKSTGTCTSVRTTVCLCTTDQQIQSSELESPRRVSVLVNGLRCNRLSVCDVDIIQRPEIGIYELSCGDIKGYISGSSEYFQVDALFTDHSFSMVQGDMKVLEIPHRIPQLTVRISRQEMDEKNLVHVFYFIFCVADS